MFTRAISPANVNCENTESSRRFQKELESARKEVECTIGNVQGRFKIVRKGNRLEWTQDDQELRDTIYFAVLLHNMILDLYGYSGAEISRNGEPMQITEILDEYTVTDEHVWDRPVSVEELVQNVHEAEDLEEHHRLRQALIL